jgi:arylamine N-acetyltransferase
MLGRPPKLDVASLQSKIIARKRGGYCFEQNMLFRAGLRSLGYRITSLQGRVVRGLEINAPRPAIHMLLQVELPEGVYLADVGFGNLAPTSALLLAPQIEQETPHELMRFIDVGGELTLQARLKQAGSTSTGSSPIRATMASTKSPIGIPRRIPRHRIKATLSSRSLVPTARGIHNVQCARHGARRGWARGKALARHR